MLTISLAFTIASGYELYKLADAYNELYVSIIKNQKPTFQNITITTSQLQQPRITLAQKNLNPLNIKQLPKGQLWQGQVGVDKFGHVIFSSWEYGVRAASFTLRSYARRHKIDTVSGLVDRFCEAKGKNYDAYVNYICRRIGVEKNQKIDLVEYMPKLLRIMARYESGMNLPEELFVPYDVVAFL